MRFTRCTRVRNDEMQLRQPKCLQMTIVNSSLSFSLSFRAKMVQAIQVLRFHLLELEKVSCLCVRCVTAGHCDVKRTRRNALPQQEHVKMYT